ncbi:MAG: flagellar hook assembly protein FlgD [Deltaproteobacteria bacterium]|nr:flagellar hook assembly protein FlgD [Deltaproteobacteria bacterium]MCB9787797.1 flagellar hook assembly protein FlgD [Deltaproteobacteria bacterium]
MDIAQTAALTQAGSAAAPAAANPDASFDRQAFLRLLTTQLTHQDPLAPSDPTEFVSQLAQFSSLEQLVSVNSNIEILALSQSSATSAQMVSFVGKDVVFDDDKVVLAKPGEAHDLFYRLEAEAKELTVEVKDASGAVVRTVKVSGAAAGEGQIAFDGNDDQGNPLAAGTYSVVMNAVDAAGEPVEVSTRALARIAGITFKNGYPELLSDDIPPRTITLASVVEVHEPAASSTSTEQTPAR